MVKKRKKLSSKQIKVQKQKNKKFKRTLKKPTISKSIPQKPTPPIQKTEPPLKKITPKVETTPIKQTPTQSPTQKKELTSKKTKLTENDEEPAGQFLITYSWAILVIIGAIAALIYFSISSTGLVFEKCTIPQSSGLSCNSFNIAPENIVLNISRTEISDKNNSCKLNQDTLILAKNSTSLTFNTAGSIGSCKELLTNTKIKAKINITYKDINLTSKSTTGKLVAKTQPSS
jgi:hypothetical protein